MSTRTVRHLPVAVFLVLVGFAVAACSGGASEAPAPATPAVADDQPPAIAIDAAMMQRGNTVYQMNCAPCHGATGKGDGPGAAALNPKPRDHSNGEYMDALTDQKIADVVTMGGIISGYPNMPSSPHIRGDDLVALVAFVRTLPGRTVSEVRVKR